VSSMLIQHGRPPSQAGVASAAPADATDAIFIDFKRSLPLRLNNSGYWPQTRPGDDLSEGLLACVRRDIARRCGEWNMAARRFVEQYFDSLDRHLAQNGAAIVEAAADKGAIFGARDWIFAALRPLPQALIPTGDGRAEHVDFIFWTGNALVAIDASDRGLMPGRARSRREAIARAAVNYIAFNGAEPDWPSLLNLLSPESDGKIWSGSSLPIGLRDAPEVTLPPATH